MLRIILNYVTRNSGEDQFDVSMHPRSGREDISFIRILSLIYVNSKHSFFPGDTIKKYFGLNRLQNLNFECSPLLHSSLPCCPLSQQSLKSLKSFSCSFRPFFISQPTRSSLFIDLMTISTGPFLSDPHIQ